MWGCDLAPALGRCSGSSKIMTEVRSVARCVARCRRLDGRAMELVSGHEVFLGLSHRGALSILDAIFKVARSNYFVSAEPWLLCLLASNCALQWSDVRICCDASEKVYWWAIRDGCRELAASRRSRLGAKSLQV